jgi:hypothetical protein
VLFLFGERIDYGKGYGLFSRIKQIKSVKMVENGL